MQLWLDRRSKQVLAGKLPQVLNNINSTFTIDCRSKSSHQIIRSQMTRAGCGQPIQIQTLVFLYFILISLAVVPQLCNAVMLCCCYVLDVRGYSLEGVALPCGAVRNAIPRPTSPTRIRRHLKRRLIDRKNYCALREKASEKWRMVVRRKTLDYGVACCAGRG